LAFLYTSTEPFKLYGIIFMLVLPLIVVLFLITGSF